MQWLYPWGLAALLSLPAIAALYFLRKKRRPRVVGSLLLWAEARVAVYEGRPWQRFRTSVLLWPQLIAALVLAVALGRPACLSDEVDADHLVIVIDASASMAATDGSPTRFADAISGARALMASAPKGSRFSLLSAGSTVRLRVPATEDRGEVERALDLLDDAGPEDAGASLREAIVLAAQISASEDRHVTLFSDGAGADQVLPAAAGGFHFVSVGAGSHNLAITAIEIRRRPGRRFGTTVWCRIANTGDAAMSAHFQLEVDGIAEEAQAVQLAPGQSRSMTFPLSVDNGEVTARLLDIQSEDGAPDLLDRDNTAYAVIAPELPITVLTVGANPLLVRALHANPRLSVTSIDPEAYVDDAGYEVTVFEGFFPTTIPAGRFLAFAPPDGSPLFDRSGDPIEGPQVASWDFAHPVLYQVNLADVRFSAVRRVRPHDAFIPIAEFSDGAGPYLMVAQTPTWRGVVASESLLETDLPLKVAFPILLYNAIGWLNPAGNEDRRGTLRAGQTAAITATPGSVVTVIGPGTQRQLRTGPDGALQFDGTGRRGFYRVKVGDASVAPFGVSVVSEAESTLAPRRSLDRAAGPAVASVPVAGNPVEWVRPLVVAALALVALEWMLFLWRRRRPAAPRET